MIGQEILEQAIQYLDDGNETKAATILRNCKYNNCQIVDNRMEGNLKLDGLLLDLSCARSSYQILSNPSHSITKSIRRAIIAVLPSDKYLEDLRVRASTTKKSTIRHSQSGLTARERKSLYEKIVNQKSIMISVATGGPLIKKVSPDYEARRLEIRGSLQRIGIEDPNPFPDLWTWYGKWSDGSLPTYASRRQYITALYQPLLDALEQSSETEEIHVVEPTGWARVDRNMEKIVKALESSQNEEDFQLIGLLCREAIISLAQTVYDPSKHESPNGINASSTDAKRMLEGFIEKELIGQANKEHRKYAKSSYDLTTKLQHNRTATFRDAALCAEATRSIVNVIAIISGKRDPDILGEK